MYDPGQKKIALCMGLNDYYEHGIARGVVRYAKEHPSWKLYGYGWMFRPVDQLEFWQGDGIITRVESREEADRLSALKLPVVDVAGAYIRTDFHQVNNDDFLTGIKAGEYLISCGFKHMAFCGVKNVGWSKCRLEGFTKSIGPVCPNISVFEQSLSWWEHLEESANLEEWLETLEYPTGIFACNDTAGVKLSELCRQKEIPIPETIAILGVDNEDILCELSSPSLSSITLDCQSIGYRAASLLDEILIHPDKHLKKGPGILIPPGEINERESTSVFTCEDKLVEQAVRFIRAHGIEGINVGDVLDYIPVSRRNLEIRFKKERERTLLEEILRVRIDHAKTLLKRTNLTIAEISDESGFGTLQRFHLLFRKHIGCTPGQYRG